MNELFQDKSSVIRMAVAMVLITGIFIGWDYLFPAPRPHAQSNTDGATEMAISNFAPNMPAPSLLSAPVAVSDGLSDGLSDGGSDANSDQIIAEVKPAPLTEQFVNFSQGATAVELSSQGGSFTKWDLKNFTLREGEGAKDDGQTDARHVSMVATRQLRLTLGDSVNMPEMFKVVASDGQKATLVGENDQVRVELQYTHVDDYIMDVSATVTNLTPFGTKLVPQVVVQGIESQSEGSFMAPSYDVLKLKCLVDDDLEDELSTKVKKGGKDYKGEVAWVGVDRQYFLAAVGPQPGSQVKGHLPEGTCHFNVKEEEKAPFAEATYIMAPKTLPAGGVVTIDYRAFIGPKMEKEFDKAAMKLDESVDYVLWGIPLAFLAKPMLWLMGIFYDLTASWGLAIILLTIVVKLLLMPINHKSMISMRNMQKLQPKMEEIKKRFPNDQEAQSREMMKFYQQEHINPMSGCLPMFLQMPILCALYRAIGAAVELYQQPFLWISDLSMKEPIPFLAIAMALIMLLQQKLTTSKNKPMNDQAAAQMKMMMYGMPIFMGFIMMALPSGLVLYTVVNCILSIFHQLYINKTYKAD